MGKPERPSSETNTRKKSIGRDSRVSSIIISDTRRHTIAFTNTTAAPEFSLYSQLACEKTKRRVLCPYFHDLLKVHIVESDLHGARLRFCSSIINELFHHRTISQPRKEDLAHLTSPSNVNPTSATKPSTASGEDDSDFSSDGIYKSEADKQHIQELRKFQRDIILTERFRILHLREQDIALESEVRGGLSARRRYD